MMIDDPQQVPPYLPVPNWQQANLYNARLHLGPGSTLQYALGGFPARSKFHAPLQRPIIIITIKHAPLLLGLESGNYNYFCTVLIIPSVLDIPWAKRTPRFQISDHAVRSRGGVKPGRVVVQLVHQRGGMHEPPSS